MGNIPYEGLLSAEKSQRIKYIIDYADEAEDSRLPPYDLVFNAIGEPDVAVPLTARLTHFLAHCSRPVMNLPETVARTRRHLLKERMAGIAHVQVANCCRIDPGDLSPESLKRLLTEEGIPCPVLVRPAETHGGQGLVCCATLSQISDQLSAGPVAHYLSHFVDTRSSDGFFRKYRVIFVDRQPYPYHLAISSQWMVHYHTSEMTEFPWKIAEERRFLQDMEAVLGKNGMAALIDIGQRLDLDYAGIDFTLLPDGQLFIFEANATMLVHRVSDQGPLAYKNAHIQKIADAFEALQARHMANPSIPSNPV